MDPITGALLGSALTGGSNLLSSFFNANQSGQNIDTQAFYNQQAAQQNYNYSREFMQRQQDYNQNMVTQQNEYNSQQTSSAYQRAKRDMQAAGLNPMLMTGQGGAQSVPGQTMGVTPSVPRAEAPNALGKTSALAGLGPSMQSAINSAIQIRTADATIDNLVEDNARIKADAKLKTVQQGTEAERAGLYRAESTNKQTALKSIQRDAAIGDAEKAFVESPAGRKLVQAAFGGRKVDDVFSPVGNLASTAKSIKYLTGPSGRRSTQEHTRSDGSSSFSERFNY